MSIVPDRCSLCSLLTFATSGSPRLLQRPNTSNALRPENPSKCMVLKLRCGLLCLEGTRHAEVFLIYCVIKINI